MKIRVSDSKFSFAIIPHGLSYTTKMTVVMQLKTNVELWKVLLDCLAICNVYFAQLFISKLLLKIFIINFESAKILYFML